MGTNRWLAVWTYGVLVFLLGPFAIILYASFSDSPMIGIPLQDPGFRAYADIFVGHRYVFSLWLSLRVAVVATLAALLLGTAASLVLVRKRHYRLIRLLSALMLAPLTIPLVIIGIALLIMFNRMAVPLHFWTLAAVHVVILLPYVIRTVSASLEHFNPSIEEAALNLGAGPWRTLFEITIPNLRPALITGGMLAFITSFGETVVTVFILPPGKQTLPVDIFNTLVYNFSPSIAAISALVSVLVFAVVWLMSVIFPNLFATGNSS